jgi:SsrA-binding protein
MATNRTRRAVVTYDGDRETPIVRNRRAPFDYTIGDRYEGGLVLVGSEVKALRLGKVAIIDAFASVQRGELWLNQLNIGAFEMARTFPHTPRRARKVLLHKKEILAIERAVAGEGATIIPLRLYFKGGRVKVELGVAKGKKHHDKRHIIAKKTADEEAKAMMTRARSGKAR